MKMGDALLKKLNKKYEPAAMVSLKFREYDMAMKTDEEGNPILLFIGKLGEDGMIKGDRYARRLLKNANGGVIKDHWDYKGRV
jgi:hypothetical protein